MYVLSGAADARQRAAAGAAGRPAARGAGAARPGPASLVSFVWVLLLLLLLLIITTSIIIVNVIIIALLLLVVLLRTVYTSRFVRSPALARQLAAYSASSASRIRSWRQNYLRFARSYVSIFRTAAFWCCPAWSRKLAVYREGTCVVNTNGGTANAMFFGRDICWVLPLTYFCVWVPAVSCVCRASPLGLFSQCVCVCVYIYIYIYQGQTKGLRLKNNPMNGFSPVITDYHG